MKNILLKNLLDACVGALIWWGWGYAMAYDKGDGFIGMTDTKGVAPSFFLNGATEYGKEHPQGYALAAWFFQYVFAAAASTIVSGAMAERTALGGYIIYTIVLTAFIYPVVVHWGWSGDGWASAWREKDLLVGCGAVDFAGSGVVHMTGGVAAVIGATIL